MAESLHHFLKSMHRYEKKIIFYLDVSKRTFLLKELAVFDAFFAIVRSLPYNAQKTAKNC